MYIFPDEKLTIGFRSTLTGFYCYAGYLEDESHRRGHCVCFAYMFDADGNPIAWSKFTGTTCLADLTEKGCSFRFDYLYGDAEAFGEMMESTTYSGNYEKIENPDMFFENMASSLESDTELFYNRDFLAISDGKWIIDNCFPQPGSWLHQENRTSISRS